MKSLWRLMGLCLAAAALPLAAGAATSNTQGKSVVKNSTPAQIAADEAKHPRLERYYVVYVLTTESRIPKRYVYRAGSVLATGSPERIIFNRHLLPNGFRIVR
jgi:hypothetical protein